MCSNGVPIDRPPRRQTALRSAHTRLAPWHRPERRLPGTVGAFPESARRLPGNYELEIVARLQKLAPLDRKRRVDSLGWLRGVDPFRRLDRISRLRPFHRLGGLTRLDPVRGRSCVASLGRNQERGARALDEPLARLGERSGLPRRRRSAARARALPESRGRLRPSIRPTRGRASPRDPPAAPTRTPRQPSPRRLAIRAEPGRPSSLEGVGGGGLDVWLVPGTGTQARAGAGRAKIRDDLTEGAEREPLRPDTAQLLEELQKPGHLPTSAKIPKARSSARRPRGRSAELVDAARTRPAEGRGSPRSHAYRNQRPQLRRPRSSKRDGRRSDDGKHRAPARSGHAPRRPRRSAGRDSGGRPGRGAGPGGAVPPDRRGFSLRARTPSWCRRRPPPRRAATGVRADSASAPSPRSNRSFLRRRTLAIHRPRRCCRDGASD